MRFTRRRLERSASGLLALFCFAAAGVAVASCSSNDDDGGGASQPESSDASVDAAPEAGEDVAVIPDAEPIDLTPLPVVCSSPPCATALVTTLGATVDDRGEGFCALMQDGTVACWGANGAGQLGRGDDAGTLDSAEPQRVVGLADVATLDHTCSVDKSGGVWCWGTGPFGRADAGAATTEREPVKLDLPPATNVGHGYATACAVIGAEIRCWGSNADAQLRPISTPPSEPSETDAPVTIPLPAGAAARSLAIGRATFTLREDGTLVTWGANPPLGRVSSSFPDPSPGLAPLAGVTSVDLAYDNACATAGGIGYCWGARVLPPTWSSGSVLERALPEPVVAPEPLVQIATTRTYDVENIGVQRYRWCATSATGNLYCWGFNESGQAGDGTQNYVYDARVVKGLPERVARVKTTPNTTCALLTNGKVYCWGGNYTGQLGNGQIKGKAFTPVEVQLP